MHTQHSWAGDRNCSYGYKYIKRAYDTWAAASFRHTPRSEVSSSTGQASAPLEQMASNPSQINCTPCAVRLGRQARH